MSLIVPDVNVLVYSFRRDSQRHEVYANWLNRMLADREIGVADVILSGFVHIVTHPKIMRTPAPTDLAVEFTKRLAARSAWLTQGPSVWSRFSTICDGDHGIRANLVPDAYIAAMALENGARLASRDLGFRRFAGLRVFDPGQ